MGGFFMDLKKFGIVYLLVGFVAVVFVLTRFVFPGVTMQDLMQQQVERTREVQDASATPSASSAETVTNGENSQTMVLIDFGDSERTYQNINATNAYAALTEAAGRDGLDVVTKDYDFGKLVESINNKANTTDRVWVYYVNGASADVAADRKSINPGDRVEWKYVKPQ